MTRAVDVLKATYLRELQAYFLSPLAYVFIAIFLVALGAFTFEIGDLFGRGRADLSAFFVFHPWLYLVFLPAVGMRLWSEEIRSGTIELIMTMPAPIWVVVLGKFLAAWTVAGVALFLSLPIWISIVWLGEPDNATIAVSYLVSFLLAGCYVAVACAMSALGASQVIAFVLAVTVGFLFTVAGLPLVQSGIIATLGPTIGETISALSLLTQFDAAQRGVLEFRSVFYFVSFIVLWLALTALWIDQRREGV